MDQEIKDGRKKRIVVAIISAFILLIIGSSITFLILSLIYGLKVGMLSAQHWAIITTIGVIALFLVNIYRIKRMRADDEIEDQIVKEKKEKEETHSNNLRTDFEKFKRECLHSFRGLLKISTLFWIHYTKKEKVQSLDETKKEVFKDLKREFTDIPWMHEIIDEVRKDISRYEKGVKKEDSPPSPPEGGG